jgi:hypothetical protein
MASSADSLLVPGISPRLFSASSDIVRSVELLVGKWGCCVFAWIRNSAEVLLIVHVKSEVLRC